MLLLPASEKPRLRLEPPIRKLFAILSFREHAVADRSEASNLG